MSSNKSYSESDGSPMEGVRFVISVKEARKILGVEADQLSDNDIIRLISSFTKMADALLSSSI